AVQLHGERDLRWWQLVATVPSRVTTTLLLVASVLTVGLINGLTYWLIVALSRTGVRSVDVLLQFGLVSALGMGPLFGLIVVSRARRAPEPGYADWRLRGRGRDLVRELGFGLVQGLVVMLGIGVVGGVVAKLVNGPDYYALHNLLLLGLYIGPVAGLAGGLANWVK